MAADSPVLVDFWAPWCGPCRVQGPVVEELAREMNGKKVKIGKMNVDENPETAQRYGVMSIPTLMIFKKGEVVQQLVGVQTKEKLSAALAKVIAN
ncbi:thioredoxin [Patescibacteria group bacterium]|nr:MAG: thioredoxin [Patescibacteria group bacterium]